MNTKPWSKPVSPAAAGISTFDAFAKLDVTDSKTSSPLSIMGAMYVVIASLRKKTPVQVSHEGVDLYVFDGSSVEQTIEFASLLEQFEFCLLNERRAGYTDAMDWIQTVVDANPVDAARQVRQALAAPVDGQALQAPDANAERADNGDTNLSTAEAGTGDANDGERRASNRRRR